MAVADLTLSTGSNYTVNFTVRDVNNIIVDLTDYTATMYVVETPGSFSSTVFSTSNGKLVNGGSTGVLTLSLLPADIALITGTFYKLEIVDSLGNESEASTGSIFILDETKVGVEYLIPYLRLRVGDTNPTAYRYVDGWLKNSLILALKSLQRWWKDKYLVTDSGVVTRSSYYLYYSPEDLDRVIERADEYIIILKAAILVLSGVLEENSWNLGSWKDAEISYSNIESGKTKTGLLQRMEAELEKYLLPPTKRLAGATKQSLPGYLGNSWERGTDY